jgi:IS1 family transposase
MNKLPDHKRAQILQLHVEGNSMRSITRIVGVSINTVTKLLAEAGAALADFHHWHVRDLGCRRVQCDKVWSFTSSKAKNVATAKNAPPEAGDTWSWTAICADSKLIITWTVGGRDAAYANAFMEDVAARLKNRVQLTTDGWKAYLEAVRTAFTDIDYGMLVKLYGAPVEGGHRYSPPECLGAFKQIVEGAPDPKHISTSYAERNNLSMRMGMRRYTRLTNGFSKKIENHCAALAIYFAYYNFVKIHGSLRMSPAMAAGIAERLWDMSDLLKIVDEYLEAKKAA